MDYISLDGNKNNKHPNKVRFLLMIIAAISSFAVGWYLYGFAIDKIRNPSPSMLLIVGIPLAAIIASVFFVFIYFRDSGDCFARWFSRYDVMVAVYLSLLIGALFRTIL